MARPEERIAEKKAYSENQVGAKAVTDVPDGDEIVLGAEPVVKIVERYKKLVSADVDAIKKYETGEGQGTDKDEGAGYRQT